jgi:hypothetical protein
MTIKFLQFYKNLNSPLEKDRIPKARFRPRATVFNARFRPVSKAGTHYGLNL